MKLLHTSDWHIGGTLHRHQRLEEIEALLDEIVDIAKDEEVDLVLVCGDIYESFAPSAEAERILYDTLLALSKARIPVVVVAGNHDYARRLLAVEPLLEAIDIHVVAEPRKADEGGILEIASRDGSEVAQVAALPWVPERRLFGAEEMMGLEGEPYQVYAERIPLLLKALSDEFDPAKVSVLAGHLFIDKSKPAGGERELTIGDLFAVSAASLPTNAQYIALGHVHRPQSVAGSPVPARYCGSPMQIDFGEAGQQKSVTLVDLQPGRPAKAREVELTKGRQLVDLELSIEQVDMVEVDEDAFLRVFLSCDGPVPGLVDRVREALPNAVEIRLDYEREDVQRDLADLAVLTPAKQFELYYKRQHGRKPDKSLRDLFNELHEEVTNAAAAH